MFELDHDWSLVEFLISFLLQMSHRRRPCVLLVTSDQEAHDLLFPTLKDAEIYHVSPFPVHSFQGFAGLLLCLNTALADPQTLSVTTTPHFIPSPGASVCGLRTSSHGPIRETEITCKAKGPLRSPPSAPWWSMVLESPRQELP